MEMGVRNVEGGVRIYKRGCFDVETFADEQDGLVDTFSGTRRVCLDEVID